MISDSNRSKRSVGLIYGILPLLPPQCIQTRQHHNFLSTRNSRHDTVYFHCYYRVYAQAIFWDPNASAPPSLLDDNSVGLHSRRRCSNLTNRSFDQFEDREISSGSTRTDVTETHWNEADANYSLVFYVVLYTLNFST